MRAYGRWNYIKCNLMLLETKRPITFYYDLLRSIYLRL